MNDTLLVVDVQEAMYSHPRHSIYRTDQALERIRSLIEEARATHVPVVYVQHDGNLRRSKAARLLYPEIAPQDGDLVIWSRRAVTLDELLLRQELETGNIRTLVITGLDVGQCLDTALDLTLDLDKDVTVVLDTYNVCNN